MKFDVWKNILSQSSYFKSRLDPVTLEKLGGGNLKSLKTLKIGMKLGGKNKQRS